MLLFFVRHGDPTYDPDELTPLGHRQAEAIGRRLSRYGLDEIYVSSSTRAIETSTPACELLKMGETILDWTNECHAYAQQSMLNDEGERRWCFQIKRVVDIFASKSMRDLGNKWYEHPFFEGHPEIKEGFFRIDRETKTFLAAQGFEYDEERGAYKNTAHNEKRVALFAHAGFGSNFIATILDLPWPQVCVKTELCHTALTVFYFNPNDEYVIPKMLTMSNDGHLLADNLPTYYNNYLYF